jgi:hypothetical protein
MAGRKIAVYAVDDMSPSLTMEVKRGYTNEVVNLTGITNLEFFLYDNDAGTYKLNADTAGVTVADAVNGLLDKDWQTGDLDTAGTYIAWFEYQRSSKKETAGAIEVKVVPAYEKVVLY